MPVRGGESVWLERPGQRVPRGGGPKEKRLRKEWTGCGGQFSLDRRKKGTRVILGREEGKARTGFLFSFIFYLFSFLLFLFLFLNLICKFQIHIWFWFQFSTSK